MILNWSSAVEEKREEEAMGGLSASCPVPSHRLHLSDLIQLASGPALSQFTHPPQGSTHHTVLLEVPGGLEVAVPPPYQLLTYKCPSKENIFILL